MILDCIKHLIKIGLAVLLLTPLGAFPLYAKPHQTSSNFLKIVLFPSEVKQGQSFTVFLESAVPLKSIKLTGLDRDLFIYRIWHEKHSHLYRAILGVPATQKTGPYKIAAEIIDRQNEKVRIYTTLNIIHARYKVQHVNLPKKKLGLLNAENLIKEGRLLGKKLRIRQQKVYFASHFMRPAKGRISSPFGVSRRYNNDEVSSYHKGIDIANRTGTPVWASNGGRVSLAEDLESNGKIVLIDHGHGITTIYSHLNAIRVKARQWVKQGEVIGEIGTTGISSGPHLHFGVSVNNVRVDPMQWLQGDITLYYNAAE